MRRRPGFDASNQDDAINIRDWPVLGIPHPDALAAYQVGGETFLVTANEGDAPRRSAWVTSASATRTSPTTG